ncbi:MAG: hypothetical protein LQ340_000159 [Diploschistes diacapsis]|nr:MAG: hypothetical protein LQ340_000159 [Diploschistes diacapsis]
MMSRGDQHFPFLRLPGELRELIYLKALAPVENTRDLGDGHKAYAFDLSIFRVNQQLYYEARKIFRDNNVFVVIATPWHEAQQHVRMEGFVPILATGEKARMFKDYHLGVTIDAPGHSRKDALVRFLILVDDLKRFCNMWFYSDLGLPGLNAHLRLTLVLQDPYAPPFDPRPVSKALQRRLLEPFGVVKGLYHVTIKGEHYPSIEKSMRDEMAIPYKSPTACLEEAMRLKGEGNTALQGKRYREAIELYEQAFLAVHIVCEGRRRSVMADPFFQTEITEGTFKGQYGHIARLRLRVQLVANVVHAYVNLENYEEARFWGERSINLMRQAVGGDDEPMHEFVASKEMGKIYYRTGKACKALADFEAAKQYFRIALAHLPGDRDQINHDLNSCHAPRSESV